MYRIITLYNAAYSGIETGREAPASRLTAFEAIGCQSFQGASYLGGVPSEQR